MRFSSSPRSLPWSIAEACGCPVKVLGDAFIARLKDSDDDFARMDFALAELNSDSKWIKVARDLNIYRHQGEGANRLSEMIKAGEVREAMWIRSETCVVLLWWWLWLWLLLLLFLLEIHGS